MTAVLVSSIGLWAVLLPHPARREGSGVHQPGRHLRQDGSAGAVRRHRRLRLQGRRVRRQLLGRRRLPIQPLFEQVRGTMLVTVFVFLGIEGASVYSRFAKKREDVGRATVLGFLGVLAPLRGGDAALLRRAAARRDRRPASAVGGRRARGRGRTLGRGLHQRRPDRLGARRLYGLDADLRRSALQRRPRRGHAGASSRTRTRTRCRRPRCWLTTVLVQVFLITTFFSADAFTFTLNAVQRDCR